MTAAEDYTEDFSQIPGFRLQDFDASCTVTGEECPVKVDLVQQYVGDAGQGSDDGEPSKYDRKNKLKLMAKLTEYKLVDNFVDYSNQQPGTCPTRDAMNGSPVRQTTVKGIRKLIHFSKG